MFAPPSSSGWTRCNASMPECQGLRRRSRVELLTARLLLERALLLVYLQVGTKVFAGNSSKTCMPPLVRYSPAQAQHTNSSCHAWVLSASIILSISSNTARSSPSVLAERRSLNLCKNSIPDGVSFTEFQKLGIDVSTSRIQRTA